VEPIAGLNTEVAPQASEGQTTQFHSKGAGLRAANSRVLVIEDEDNERQALAELLRLWGHEVETASNGQEGLEKVTSFTPPWSSRT
jgi:PleD family two-component response regulator